MEGLHELFADSAVGATEAIQRRALFKTLLVSGGNTKSKRGCDPTWRSPGKRFGPNDVVVGLSLRRSGASPFKHCSRGNEASQAGRFMSSVAPYQAGFGARGLNWMGAEAGG